MEGSFWWRVGKHSLLNSLLGGKIRLREFLLPINSFIHFVYLAPELHLLPLLFPVPLLFLHLHCLLQWRPLHPQTGTLSSSLSQILLTWSPRRRRPPCSRQVTISRSQRLRYTQSFRLFLIAHRCKSCPMMALLPQRNLQRPLRSFPSPQHFIQEHKFTKPRRMLSSSH